MRAFILLSFSLHFFIFFTVFTEAPPLPSSLANPPSPIPQTKSPPPPLCTTTTINDNPFEDSPLPMRSKLFGICLLIILGMSAMFFVFAFVSICFLSKHAEPHIVRAGPIMIDNNTKSAQLILMLLDEMIRFSLILSSSSAASTPVASSAAASVSSSLEITIAEPRRLSCSSSSAYASAFSASASPLTSHPPPHPKETLAIALVEILLEIAELMKEEERVPAREIVRPTTRLDVVVTSFTNRMERFTLERGHFARFIYSLNLTFAVIKAFAIPLLHNYGNCKASLASRSSFVSKCASL